MNEMNFAPIILFVYNRLDKVKNVISGLLKNSLAKYSELYIFSDYPRVDKDEKEVKRVREYIKTILGFKNIEIIEYKQNKGIEKSYEFAFDYMFKKYDRIIVLEDDIYPAPHFLDFMNDGLKVYKDEDKVCSIGSQYVTSRNKDLTFVKGASTWGWAVWKDSWQNNFIKDENILRQQLIEKNLVNEFNFNGNYPFFEMLKKQKLTGGGTSKSQIVPGMSDGMLPAF